MKIKGNIIDSKVTDDLINIREKRWNKTLPCSFKEFFKENNGIIPETRVMLEDNLMIERFLCILPSVSQSEEGINDIDAVLTKFDAYMVFSEDTIGYDLIPFAKLNRDKLLCLCYEKETPSICVWRQEGSKEFAPNYTIKYNSFDEFLNKVFEI